MITSISLSMQSPQLANEFHPTKNEDQTLDQFSIGSGKKVWWQCQQGHEWETMVLVRTRFQSDCPMCQTKKRS